MAAIDNGSVSSPRMLRSRPPAPLRLRQPSSAPPRESPAPDIEIESRPTTGSRCGKRSTGGLRSHLYTPPSRHRSPTAPQPEQPLSAADASVEPGRSASKSAPRLPHGPTSATITPTTTIGSTTRPVRHIGASAIDPSHRAVRRRTTRRVRRQDPHQLLGASPDVFAQRGSGGECDLEPGEAEQDYAGPEGGGPDRSRPCRRLDVAWVRTAVMTPPRRCGDHAGG